MEEQKEDPLQALLDVSWDHLQTHQKHLEDACEGYEFVDYDLEEGYMELAKNEHQKMRIPIYPVGTFSQNDSVWWWAWANSSLAKDQRKRSKQFKELYKDTGIKFFKKKAFKADLDLVWQLLSVCFSTSDDLGIYHLELEEDLILFLFVEQS